MTISSSTYTASYTASGSTTAFTVPFYFTSNSDVLVYLVDTNGTQTLQTITTQYTIAGAGVPSGGTVTFVSAPTAGLKVYIERDPAITQLVDYQSNDPFPAETHEAALDKLTMIAQNIDGNVSRSIRFPTSDTASSGILVGPALRANKALVFDASGNATVSSDNYVNQAANALTYATAAGNSATSASNSAASAASSLSTFRGVYYGSYATDPALDPNGAAMTAGDLYYNTTSSSLKIYTGAVWTDTATAAPVTFTTQLFSGNGSTTAFTLSSAPPYTSSVSVYVAGLSQRPTTDFSTASTTLTFVTAPASGTNNILVRWPTSIAAGVPNDDSVSTNKLQALSVTLAKMAANSVDSSKIVDGSIASGDLASGVALANLGYTPVNKAGDTITGTINTSAAINFASAPTVASASTTDIGAAASNTVVVSGTTTISSLGTAAAGITRRVRFSGILLLTYNATSLILPTAANITTAANDVALFYSEGSGNWRCLEYYRGNGTALVGAAGSVDLQTFNSSGTWTKPATGSMANIRIWSGGAGGGRSASVNSAGGGAGGGYVDITIPLSYLAASVSITVGAGGTGATATGSGVAGGNSIVPIANWEGKSISLTVYGGSAGGTTFGGTGGGEYAFVAAGSPSLDGGQGQATCAIINDPKNKNGGGGGGFGNISNPRSVAGGGGIAYYGGAGGNSGTATVQTSAYGGNGGNASTAGTAPAGGGGASAVANTNGTNGAAGRVVITTY